MNKKSMLLILPCFLLFFTIFNTQSATSAERKASNPATVQSPDDITLVSIAYAPNVTNYSDEDEVYGLVKQALEQLNPSDPQNPLSNLIEPGDVVVLKPNLVDADMIAFEGCTRTPVLRPIIDLAVKARASKVVIAEGPSDPDWNDEAFYSANVTDLVNEMQNKYPDVSISYQNINKDNWTWVDLDQYSTFYGVYTAQELYSLRHIRMDQDSYYYATDSKGYNPHGYTPGLYAIANTIFEADVLINVPKMKVHHITGVTMSLKNLIGITVSDTRNTTKQEGGKDIPHWNTSYSQSGEEKKRIDTFENDVIWRVNADLHKIALYVDKDGNLQPTKQRKYLSVLDGIIGMEGPITYDKIPDPRPTGAIVAGQDPVAVDIAGSRIMGFNYTVLYSLTNMAKVSDHIFGTTDPAKICVLGTSLTRETFGESYVPHVNYEDDHISPYKIRLQHFDPPDAEVKTHPETPREDVETKVIVYTQNINLVAAGWLRYSLDDAKPRIMKMVPNGETMIGNLGLLEGGTRVSYNVCVQDYFLNTNWSDKISVVVASVLVVTATASPVAIYSGGTLTIKMSVNSGGTPVTGATVTLTSDKGGSFSTVTDHANGTYTAIFTAPTVTTSTVYVITASASKVGYMSGSGQTQVTVQPSPALAVTATASPATIYSGGTSTVKVSVVSGGTAVTGATVSLTSDKGGAFSAVTDHTNGTYSATFTAPDITTQTTCTITVAVSKSGYTSGSGQTQVTVQPLVLNIVVKDAGGNPIAGATVVSTSQPSSQTALSGTTDANGLVVFTGILKGSYTFKASKSGYEEKTWTVTVVAGKAATEAVTLSKPPEFLIWVITAIVAIIVMVGAVFAMKKRKPK